MFLRVIVSDDESMNLSHIYSTGLSTLMVTLKLSVLMDLINIPTYWPRMNL